MFSTSILCGKYKNASVCEVHMISTFFSESEVKVLNMLYDPLDWKVYRNHYKTNLKQFPVTCHAHDTIPN